MERTQSVRAACLIVGISAAICGGSHIAAADESPAVPSSKSNALLNGDFHEWKTYKRGVTTESVGTPANSLPLHWYGGPGVGAIATYDRLAVSRTKNELAPPSQWFFRIAWSKPPSSAWPGETHHQPGFRFTFLESFEIGDVRRFAGKSVRMTFYARSPTGDVRIVPLLWHSYDSQTPNITGIKGKGYKLFESSGKPKTVAIAQGRANPAATCQLSTNWQRFEKIIALPDTAGRSITVGHYTGVGFDLVDQVAPTIDLADIEIREAE